MAPDIPPHALAVFASRLVDSTGQPILVMGSDQSQQLFWTLSNNQPKDLTITPFKSGPVSQTQYHFCFEFQPGALTDTPTVAGWEVLAIPDGHGGMKAVYVALPGNTPLVIPSAGHQTYPFIYTGAIQENSNTPQVNLTLMAGPNVMVGDHAIAGSSLGLNALTLVRADTPSISAPPLGVDFVGRRTILNDGVTANDFTFALTNMTATNITLTPEVRFTVWFEAADNHAAGGCPWAVARVDEIGATSLTPTPPEPVADWTITPNPAEALQLQAPVSRQWDINAKKSVVLTPQGSVQFTFSGLKTNLDPGFARMYLRFVGLPGFRPGVLSAVLEKTPFRYGATRGQGLSLSAGIPTGNVPPAPSAASGLYVQQFAEGAAAIFNGGPVGIGTGAATPLAKLQIVDPGQPRGKASLIIGSGTAADPSLNFGCQPGYAWIQSQVGKPLSINFLTGSGHVGIGTETPGSVLSVAGGVAIGASYADKTIPANALAVEGGLSVGTIKPSAMMQVGDTEVIQGLFSGVTTLGVLQRPNDTVGLSVRSLGKNAVLQFCTYDKNGQSQTANYLQVEQTTGDLLIGNPGAQTRFHGNNITAGNITGANIAGANANITSLSLNGPMTVAGKNGIQFGFGLPGKEGLAGQIAYQAWSEGLDIVGAYSNLKNRQIHLWDEVYVHGNLWMMLNSGQNWCSLSAKNGSVPVNDWNWATFNYSDARLKTNLASLESPLARLRTLNGCFFDWTADALSHFTKDAGANISAGPAAPAEETEALRRAERERAVETLARRQTGVIAQEVEAVLPEAVTTGEDGYKSVNYRPLVALLIEAIKEQDLAVTTLTARVDRQRDDIDRLEQALMTAPLPRHGRD